MTDDSLDPALRALADVAGVATSWVDAWGDPQTVALDDLVAVLEALTGRSIPSTSAAEDLTRELASDRPVIEPVLVAWDGHLDPVALGGNVAEGVVELEDGATIDARVGDRTLSVAATLPIGYHEVVLDGGDSRAHLFSAPRHAHPVPRGVLGLISPTYSLRRAARDTGIGSVGDLRVLADICAAADIAVVGTLPLLAAFPDQPSPYAPASRRAWNEVFVDLDAIPDWRVPIDDDALPDPAWVDYDRTGTAIRSTLASYAEHVGRTPLLRTEVDAFLEREPEMRAYARFMATADNLGRNWRGWQQGAEVLADPSRVAYHETVQWLMDRQLGDLSRALLDRGQYLYVDLPIGCHPDGYDIWDRPDLFAPASLGAPPDTLFVGGQDWGLPSPIPSVSRAEGHANFRKAIRKQLSIAGLLRIDHVMGIHRAWWVPHGRGATQGAYVMQPTDEMFAIICIESVRAGAGVVGENLGTVPPEIREGLDEHGLIGMAMAQDGVTEPRPTDLVALSSHDTPAFPAWWKGNDIEDLLELGVFDDARASLEREERQRTVEELKRRFGTGDAITTRDALMAWMASTDAAVALINLDDMLMEERRQNVPGTDQERPNWRLRHSRSLEDLISDDAFLSTLRWFAAQRPT
jgi:4-alpha-glucanotransferase